MQPELDHDGQTAPIDLADLEEDVRRGRIPGDARLRHAPWTGEWFRPLREIDALRDALDAPEARFAAWLRAPHFPWVTLGMATLVALAGLVQGLVASGRLDFEPLRTAFDLAPVGFDELILAGHWWTPWTSQLVHRGPMHLLPNIGVIAYMGYRVEKACGPGATLLVAASSVATGTLAICLLETLPAVGSSVLGFGLWGAVLALGFRMGDTLAHLRARGRYGFGSLPIFALLYAASLFNPGATHVGHLFGLVGGGAMAMVVASESLAPRRRVLGVGLRNAALAALVALVPMLTGPLLGRVPALLARPAEAVTVDAAGVTLDLPWRMTRYELRVLGMPGWTTSPNSRAVLYVDLVALREGADLQAALAEEWGRALEGELRPVPAAEAPAGWQAFAWQLHDPATGAPVDRIEERCLVRGRSVLRLGYRLDAAAEPARQALYDTVLDTARVSEPPTLSEARERLLRNPASPRMRYELARELARMADDGELAEADSLLGGLSERQDDWAWDAARLRLELWARLSARQGRDFRGGGAALAEAQAWVQGWLLRAPPLDDQIHRPGVEILVHTGACDAARSHARALVERGEASRSLGEDLLATVDAGCP